MKIRTSTGLFSRWRLASARPIRLTLFGAFAFFAALSSPVWSDERPVVVAAGSGIEMSSYYTYYLPSKWTSGPGEDRQARRTNNLPRLTVTGGGAPLRTDTFGFATAYSAATFNSFTAPDGIGVEPRFPRAPCRDFPTYVPYPLLAGHEVLEKHNWFDSELICFEHLQNSRWGTFEPGHTWSLTQRVFYDAPTRRTAVDGGQYDASRMRMLREDVPWISFYWGYRLGLVASASNWDAANLSKAPALATWPAFPDPKDNFELVALPPPWVEDDVVEYVNRVNFPLQPGGQYFYAVRAEDKTLLDSIPAWQRTGKAFKSGGYVSACRFYGGNNGGLNTHFYSADDKECAALKAIPQLSYEGQTFAANMPLPGANADGTKPCPIDSKPLYRVYNNASASNGRFVSNHRYFTDKTDVAAVVAQGWLNEGQVMCVPM